MNIRPVLMTFMFLVRIFSHNHAGRAVVIIHYTIIINVKNVHFLATKSSQVQAAATQQSSSINNTIMASGAVPIFQCGRLTRNMNIINTGLTLNSDDHGDLFQILLSLIF